MNASTKGRRTGLIPCLLATACAVLASGCGSINYFEYSGTQERWPQTNGAFFTRVNGMPIYHGFPDRPYTVLGEAYTVDYSPERMVRFARAHGADALILIEDRNVQTGTYVIPASSTVTYSSSTYGSAQTTGYVSPYTSLNTTSGSATQGTAQITATPEKDIPIYQRTDDLRLIRWETNGN